jgi:hypothetical protein
MSFPRLAGLAASLLLAAGPLRAAVPRMHGMYGGYSMSREASGTAWQPDSTPMEGIHLMPGDWMLMIHGYADGIYDRQGGPRGGAKGMSESMLMVMAQHPLWGGTAGLRAMGSLEPSMGPSGYPLLLQTGETADGATPLIDRQHPHDLFMELAAAYSHPVTENGSAFAYFGLPGEPALGPVTFMHRFSGIDNPEAPITHHWLDATHITYGVATVGYVWRNWKLEGSSFRGREPDRYRWDIEKPGFDSFSTRLSFNPAKDWALQVSYGHIVGPEALDADVNVDRLTASAMWNHRLFDEWPTQTTFAWGRNRDVPGNTLDAFLLEWAVHVDHTHSVFARAERVAKDELFAPGDPRNAVFTVNQLSLGYVYDFARWKRSRWGVGGVGTVYPLPAGLRQAYGPTPGSFMLFLRAKLS